MGPFRLIAAAAALLISAQALAFQETTIGGDGQNAPAVQALEPSKPQSSMDATKGLSLNGSELTLGRTPGTEVRIPGLGTVGVLPKLDFGLELLYGANEPKGPALDKSDSDDVQIRGTIKHRF